MSEPKSREARLREAYMSVVDVIMRYPKDLREEILKSCIQSTQIGLLQLTSDLAQINVAASNGEIKEEELNG